MNENSVCPIWGTAASLEGMSGRDGIYVDSPRAGGKYFISRRARIILKNMQDKYEQTASFDDGLELDIRANEVDRLKARLTSWLIEQRQLGVEYPEISIQTIEEIEQRRNLLVPERADRLLKYLGHLELHVGAGLGFPMREDDNRFLHMLAWSESIVSASELDSQRKEIQLFVDYLEEQGWVGDSKLDGYNEITHLTVKGYVRLAELEKVAVDSSQAFVAMWFDDSMTEVYENGIKPGIEAVGYKAFRIDKEEYLDKIDDKIIAEIRRSRFLVADFTHKDIEACQDEEERKKSGSRGSVYYEAGFADGLNIPVIFTCRVDLIDKVHFDTRQYPHITWELARLDDFREALANRIAKTIGDGPNKTQNA